jgi:carbonic anhydrase
MSPERTNLGSLIRGERTLALTCCADHLEYELPSEIFVLVPPGNVVHPHDFRLQSTIQYYVEERGCTQIMVYGQYCDEAWNSWPENKYRPSLHGMLTFNLSALVGECASPVLSDPLKKKALAELIVIEQCNQLMNYPFLRKCMDKHAVKLIGILSDSVSVYRQVYCNGISFNHLIVQN